ncbi:TraI domain-containing protein [Cupriavidus sp. CuC1]|uniref:TraI domain-containing protein n=1 Tax=Cupriavidus sp. CuC1 TaxID=3373131 RepID=UPI0037D08573
MELSIQPIDALLATLDAELLETLRSASGFSRALFDSHIQPLLDRLAECVQSLPLSRDAYNEPGGALRFGVISGLMAFRLADSAIFVPGHTAETRRVLDPQYRYSGFAAALASVPAILEAVMIVTVTGRRWSPMNQVSLTQAMVDAEVREYTVNWNPSARAPSRMVAALVAGRFFVPDLWAGFEESVIAALADAILPIRGAIAVETPLCRVVRVAQDKAFEINAKETAKRIDALGGPRLPLRDILALPEVPAMPTFPPAAPSPTAVSAAPSVVQTSEPVAETQIAAAGTSTLSPEVTELMKAISVDKDVARIRADCALKEAGYFFPKRALVRYGMTLETVIRLFVAAGLVREQTTTHLVMVPAFGTMVFGDEAA